MSWATYGEMTNQLIESLPFFQDRPFDQTFSDNSSVMTMNTYDSTEMPHEIYWDETQHDYIIPAYINYDGGETVEYLPQSQNLRDFLESFAEDVGIHVGDLKIECGVHTWNTEDMDATWLDFDLDGWETIYIEMKPQFLDINIVLCSDDGQVQEKLFQSFDENDTLCSILFFIVNKAPDFYNFDFFVNDVKMVDLGQRLGDVFLGVSQDTCHIVAEKRNPNKVINHVVFEDLTYPFDEVRFPLKRSDTYESGGLNRFIRHCLEFLKDNKMISHKIHVPDFEIEADGYMLNRGRTFEDQLHRINLCDLRLIYYPKFEIQLVMNGSRERKIATAKANLMGKDLRWKAHKAFDADFYDLKIRYRGEDVDDNDALCDVFDLNCEYADHYGLYEIEVDVRQSGGGKTTSPPEPSKSSAVRKNKLLVSKGKASEKGKDVDGNPPQFHDLFQRCAVKFALMRDNDDTEYIAKLVQQMSLQDIAQFRRATENPDIYKNGKMKFQEQTIPFIASCFVKEIAEIDAFEQRCRLLREAMISSFQHQYAMCFLGNNGNYSHPLYDLIDARETVLKQRRDDEEEFKLKYNVGNTTNMET